MNTLVPYPRIPYQEFIVMNTLVPYTRIPYREHFTGSSHIVYFISNITISHYAFVIFTSIDVEIDKDDPAIAHYVLKFLLYYPSRRSIPITYYYPCLHVHPDEIQELNSSNLSVDQILQRIFPHSRQQYD